MFLGFQQGHLPAAIFNRQQISCGRSGIPAIELSALREAELDPLIAALDSLNLQSFEYVALHAPSKLVALDEVSLVRRLLDVKTRSIPIVVHPDIISDVTRWRELGEFICIENMDRRKRTGRTCEELAYYLELLPDASWCFDIGHAHQVDPTMCEGLEMIRDFGPRLKHLHVSSVNSSGGHEAITYGISQAFRRVWHLIPANAPIILEACIEYDAIDAEVSRAAEIFDSHGAEVISRRRVTATT